MIAENNGFSANKAPDNTRIHGNSEMANRIRGKDWSKSALGPLECWSETLVACVNLILASPGTFALYWGSEQTILYNDEYSELLHEKHPSALGASGGQVWAEAWSVIEPQMRAAFENEATTRISEAYIPILAGGKLRDGWFAYGFFPIYENGRVVGIGNSGREITETVQTREGLRRTHEKLQLAMEFARQGAFFFDATTGLITVDAIAQELFEMPVAAGQAKSWISKVHPEDQERVTKAFAEAASDVGIYDLEHRIVRSDGVRWLQARARRISNPGDPVMLTGICEDITKRKVAEENLQLSAERMYLAQSTGHISSWDWDLEEGRLIWSESEWAWGRPGQDLSTADACFAYIHSDDAEHVRKALEPALAGRAEYNCEFRVLWPDRSYHWVLARGQSVRFTPNGIPTRVIGVNLDITERKLREDALLQNEKLAAVGKLASSVAHEINNPLESVTNLIYLARSAPEVSEETQEYLDIADRELRRASNIVSQTLRFHKQASRASNCSATALFHEVLSIYQGRLLNSNIDVQQRYRSADGVDCFEGEIRQVLSNLIANAIDAMPRGGRLVLRSHKVTQARTGIKGMVLTVADTGLGMSAPIRRNIFDAFFSTKGIGGTGLGLWVSKEIVDRHRGTLQVRSSQGKRRSGTIFRLFLPKKQ